MLSLQSNLPFMAPPPPPPSLASLLGRGPARDSRRIAFVPAASEDVLPAPSGVTLCGPVSVEEREGWRFVSSSWPALALTHRLSPLHPQPPRKRAQAMPPPGPSAPPLKKARRGEAGPGAQAAHDDRTAAAGPSRGAAPPAPPSAARELFPAEGVKLKWGAGRRTVSGGEWGWRRSCASGGSSKASFAASAAHHPCPNPLSLFFPFRAPASSTWATPAS